MSIAPRTFAPSKEAVLENLSFFFGEPAVPEKLRDYNEHHAMTFHFPDAYGGAGSNRPLTPSWRSLTMVMCAVFTGQTRKFATPVRARINPH